MAVTLTAEHMRMIERAAPPVADAADANAAFISSVMAQLPPQPNNQTVRAAINATLISRASPSSLFGNS